MKKITFKTSTLGNDGEYLIHTQDDIYHLYKDNHYIAPFWLIKESKSHLLFEFYLAKRMHRATYSKDELIIED